MVFFTTELTRTASFEPYELCNVLSLQTSFVSVTPLILSDTSTARLQLIVNNQIHEAACCSSPVPTLTIQLYLFI